VRGTSLARTSADWLEGGCQTSLRSGAEIMAFAYTKWLFHGKLAINGRLSDMNYGGGVYMCMWFEGGTRS
jgi:hypothetical protein